MMYPMSLVLSDSTKLGSKEMCASLQASQIYETRKSMKIILKFTNYYPRVDFMSTSLNVKLSQGVPIS